jgi:putative CocE/NonD family hydrolase
MRCTSLALAACLATAPELAAQGLEYVKANYTKFEYRIPMRDGKRLFTSVYVPKDDSQTYPILLDRTPYSVRPYGEDQYRDNLGPSPLFGKEGYIIVYQDVRGRLKSEGEFLDVRPHIANKKGPQDVDESSDTYDTIEWLLNHVPGHNGKVGLWGISYPGFYTACGMIDAHPALKAASPQAPLVDWFIGDDFHHNGAFLLPHNFNFYANFPKMRPELTPEKAAALRFDHGTPDGYQFFMNLGPLANADKKYFKGTVTFWNDCMQHGTYDEFWKARNLRPHIKDIKPAVMTVGGWFDAEDLFGTLQTFACVERTGAPAGGNYLVMGPWVHGGWSGGDGDKLGDVYFNAKTAEFFREKIEFPFFQHHLKGKGDVKFPKAWVFETGTNRWRKFDSWPPQAAQSQGLYLREGGKLSFDAPSASGKDSFDEYISDPARPVPYLEKIDIGMAPEYMTADQRFAGRRPDVLVYQTPVLDEDITIAGPLEVELHVSTSGTDSDWIVKLVDVYPDDYPDPPKPPANPATPAPAQPNRRANPDVRMGGYQQLVRGDVMRGKFRNSFEKAEPFNPGEPATVKFTIPDTLHAFRAGHRIMVQVQSSWFPLIDRNPQKFVPSIYDAKAEDFVVATQRIYTSRAHPSYVVLPLAGHR